MLDFKDRVVLVTGSGTGIGRSHALYLAGRGAKIVVNDYGVSVHGEGGNEAGPALSVVREIEAMGGEALASVTDISDPEQVRQMMDETIARWGRIDAVIHNVGAHAPLGAFEDARFDDLLRLNRVMVGGGWNVAQAAWPHFRKQGYGRIVMTGSGAGFFGRRRDQAYSAAKAGLIGLTKSLAAEGAESGIKVNIIGPVSITENALTQGISPKMAPFALPVLVSKFVTLLAHDDCPVTGEMFYVGCGFLARMFMAETQGVVIPIDDMSPEAALAQWDNIMDEADYIVPPTSSQARAHLTAKLEAANPEFAAMVAKAREEHRARKQAQAQ